MVHLLTSIHCDDCDATDIVVIHGRPVVDLVCLRCGQRCAQAHGQAIPLPDAHMWSVEWVIDRMLAKRTMN